MMDVRPTANIDDIKVVLSHPVIWESITYDGDPSPEDFDWSLYDNWLSIGGYVDGKPVAIMMLHNFNDGDKVHIHVLPEYRKEYAREFGAAGIKYAQYPVYADIPDIYQNVQAYTESFGFRHIGVFDSPRTKNGSGYKVTRYARYSA
jgi:hypothetical protein